MSKKSRREINKTLDYVDEICGILNTDDEYRAVGILKTLVKRNEYLENYVQQVVEATNTNHMGNALIKIQCSPMVRKGEILPTEMQDIPELWFIGTTKIPRLNLFQAKKKYRHLKPHMEDAWLATSGLGNERELQQAMIEQYHNSMPDQMATYCYAFLKDYEIEEEEEGGSAVSHDANMGDLNACLENLSKVDYGVVQERD